MKKKKKKDTGIHQVSNLVTRDTTRLALPRESSVSEVTKVSLCFISNLLLENIWDAASRERDKKPAVILNIVPLQRGSKNIRAVHMLREIRVTAAVVEAVVYAAPT